MSNYIAKLSGRVKPLKLNRQQQQQTTETMGKKSNEIPFNDNDIFLLHFVSVWIDCRVWFTAILFESVL